MTIIIESGVYMNTIVIKIEDVEYEVTGYNIKKHRRGELGG